MGGGQGAGGKGEREVALRQDRGRVPGQGAGPLYTKCSSDSVEHREGAPRAGGSPWLRCRQIGPWDGSELLRKETHGHLHGLRCALSHRSEQLGLRGWTFPFRLEKHRGQARFNLDSQEGQFLRKCPQRRFSGATATTSLCLHCLLLLFQFLKQTVSANDS